MLKKYFINHFRKRLEEDGHESLLCWWRLYKKTTKIWKIYQANGVNDIVWPPFHIFDLWIYVTWLFLSHRVWDSRKLMSRIQRYTMINYLIFMRIYLFSSYLFCNVLTRISSFVQLKATFCLPIIGIKKNPQSPMYTSLGVITKGTVIEVLYTTTSLLLNELYVYM